MTKANREFKKGKAAFNRRDYKTAVKLWKPLADQGHADAQNYIGIMHEWGQVLKKDKKEAIKWYRKAAAQGNASGQFNLGFCYDGGIGVRKNHKMSLQWFRKAADQGDAEAQWWVALKYRHGQGVKRDLVQAYKWDLLAAVGKGWIKRVSSKFDHPPAVYLAKQMTPKQIAKAKLLAAAWKPNPAPLAKPK